MMNNAAIMAIDDDEIDQLAIEDAVEELSIENELILFSSAEEALEYLRKPENEKPFFILLDVNMPGMDGIECLAEIKQDCHLKTIPVIMLTSSEDEEDRLKTFKLSVQGYMIKPLELDRLGIIIQTIYDYWTMSKTV